MRYDMNSYLSVRSLWCAALVLVTCSCSSVVTRTELVEVGTSDGETIATYDKTENAVAGTAVAVWEEPMVDVVDVPPGLDPEGHYYRPAHRAVVEIRQGRWQYYQRSPTAGE